MKYNLLILLLCLLVFFGCKSAARHLELGNYDAAIDKSIKSLQKKPSKEKTFILLQKAYELGNGSDNLHINALKSQGDPSLWEEIYYTYLSLDARDKKILELPDSLSKRIIPTPIDYSADIENAKLNATKFLYELALRLIATDIKADAQIAYRCLTSVKQFYPNYKDVDEQLIKARKLGTVQVLIRINNSAQWRSLPFEVRNILTDFNPTALSKEWVVFSTAENFDMKYDYFLDLFFDWSLVFPMEFEDRNYTIAKDITETRKINDSTEVEETFAINCNVTEFQQRKFSKMRSSLQFVNAAENRVVYSTPINAEFVFSNQWAIAKGDIRALSGHVLSLLSGRALPEPSEINMLVGVSEILLNEVQREIEYCALHKIE